MLIQPIRHAEIILCTGAPRSGRAVLADCLRVLGFEPLVTADQMGAEIIDRLLLQELGHSPHRIGPLPENWRESEAGFKARERILKLLASAASPSQISVTPRTLPVWLACMESQKLRTRVIHIVRHPYEVALSLGAHQGLDILQGCLLWLGDVRNVLRHQEGRKQIFITFDQLLADPVTTLCAALGDPDPAIDELPSEINGGRGAAAFTRAACLSLLDTVQPSLRHSHVSRMPEDRQTDCAAFATVYTQLRLTQTGHHLSDTQWRTGPSVGGRKGGSLQPPETSQADVINTLPPALADVFFQTIGHYEQQASLATPAAHQPSAPLLIADTPAGHSPLYATVFMPGAHGKYTEVRKPLLTDQWQKITCAISRPELLNQMPLKIAPLSVPGTASITGTRLVSQTDGQSVWSITEANDHQAATLEGPALRMPGRKHIDLLVMAPEACISLQPTSQLPDRPLRIEVWIKASPGYAGATEILQHHLDLDNWKKILADRRDYKRLDMSLRQALAELPMQQGDYFENLHDVYIRLGKSNSKVISDSGPLNTALTLDDIRKTCLETINTQDRKQIIVLGMHRSGTSAMTGALNAMGVFVGEEERLTGKNWENPRGFFERRDARNICDALLQKSDADWYKVSNFDPTSISKELLEEQGMQIDKLITELDTKAPWVLKEPRLCFLLPVFLNFLNNPVVVYVYRDPLETAKSLHRRNGFPIHAGLALWELYNISALSHSQHLDRIFVNYNTLVKQPHNTLWALSEMLTQLNVKGLSIDNGISAIDTSLHREQVQDKTYYNFLTYKQFLLWEYLANKQNKIELANTKEALLVLKEFEADQEKRLSTEANVRKLKDRLKKMTVIPEN